MSGNLLKPKDVYIERYEILNFHAAGGMQEVYKCYDHTLDRIVAIKTPKGGSKDKRFRRGAEMGARINHPNVAATFDYHEENNLTFLVEEFVSGMDLGKRLLQDFHYLDPSLAAHVIHHLAKAIHEAHRVGICHRDIKPGNIMVSDDHGISSVKLTDFGIAKLAESEIAAEINLFEQDASTLLTSNTLLGAVPYMAPECWDDWKKAGKPMDIWSLGCVAYQLLSGEPPFGSGRPAIMNVAKFQQGNYTIKDPAPFGKHKNVGNLEIGLLEIIKSCLVIDPENRIDSESLLEELDVLCYAMTERKQGEISSFGLPYASTGHVIDLESGNSYFFHESEFFGEKPPSVGQRVNFSVYHGVPNARCAPLLLLK
ncbi:TPA: serine/threonine-protein kinase [Serratia fonticola]